MREAEAREVEETIRAVIDSTNAGNIEWGQANKTTFVWTNGSGGRLVLQRTAESGGPRMLQGRVVSKAAYRLQAIDVNKQTIGFEVDTDEMPKLLNLLDELYSAIESRQARRGVDFLKSMLPR